MLKQAFFHHQLHGDFMSIALSTPLEVPVPRTPIWERSAAEVSKWSTTLSRVVSIYSELPLTIYLKAARNEKPSDALNEARDLATSAQNKIVSLWSDFQEKLRDPNLSADDASALLENHLRALPADLATIHRTGFNQTSDDVATHINKLTKDFFSATFLSVRESFLGNDGILLLRFSRAGVDPSSKWTEESAIKWTSPLEVASCNILQSFLNGIIHVQEASVLDFDQESFIKGNFKEPLPKELGNSIKKNLNSVRSNFTTKSTEATSIMLAKKLPGANLADFITGTWESLTPEHKAHIFQGIGKIALADFIMGNVDRFTMFAPDFTGFDEFFASNIGNLMIHTSSSTEDLPILYAIDNGVNNRHLADGEDYTQYNTCFSTLLATSTWKKTLAEAIIASLKESCSPYSAYFEVKRSLMSKSNRELFDSKLQFFTQDLENDLVLEALTQGLTELESHLQLKFNTEEFQNTLENIKTKYASTDGAANPSTQLCNAVQTRIRLFLNRSIEAPHE